MKKAFFSKNIFILIFLVFIFFLYTKNASRAIYGGDVGDLVTASYVVGVAHAPGYPLFTMLGYVFSHFIPIAETPAFKVGLISIISSILASFIYFKISYKFSKSYFISLLSTSILSFSYFFWFYAEIAEVFALNNFFALLIFYLALLFYEKQKAKYYFLLVFFMALSLTHHHTIVLIFPSIFTLLLVRYKFFLKNKKYILYSFIPLFLGLLPYLYVPIAASKNPVINWDKASDLRNFLYLFFRRDYGTFQAGNYDSISFLARVINLKIYLISFISNITFPAFLLSILGIFKLKEKVKIFSLILAFVLTGPFFIFYAGFPLNNQFTMGITQRFYILSSIIFLLFLPYGFLFLKDLFNKLFSKTFYSYILLCSFIIIPLYLLKFNLVKTDLSKSIVGESFAKDTLSLLPANAVVFLNGDTLLFNVWYIHYVLKFREDVEVVNISRMGNDEFIVKEENEFIKENRKVKDKNKIFTGTLLKIKEKRPVFSIGEVDIKDKQYVWVPKGLLLELKDRSELTKKDAFISETDNIWSRLNIPYRDKLTFSDRSLTLSQIPSHYAASLMNTASFLYIEYKDVENSIKLYKKSIAIDPDYPKSYASLAFVQLNNFKDCQAASSNYLKSLELNPSNINYYISLYFIYSDCFKDSQKAKELKNKYERLFGKKIEEEIKNINSK